VALWLSKTLATTVAETLALAAPGDIATIGLPALHKSLQKHRELLAWSADLQALAAVVVGGISKGQDWSQRAQGLRDSLAPGAMIVCVDRGSASEVSRRLLCAGFSDICQRKIGRQIVSCGSTLP